MQTIKTPNGNRLALNAEGAYVPVENIHEIDLLRDELVTSLATQAMGLSNTLKNFRSSALEQAEEFRQVSAQDHNIHIGGRRGGYSLLSYDGSLKIVIDNDTLIAVNEKVSIAREAILSCVRKWSDGANRNLVELVSRAFETDRQGHLSVARLLALRSYKIENDPDWDAAMDALSQGLVASGSRTYIRFYRRDESGKYIQISLN
jgi:hypothetical protein